jgi:threonine/homoserine/homoserine lactone efflux protein
MLLTIFFGFLVSFLGQLPLGNMSFTATQVGLQESISKAWQFAFGVALVEMVYLRFALTGMDWVVQHRMVYLGLGWLTVVLFLVLGIMAILSAKKQQTESKALVLNNKLNRFVLGLTMSALNPVQIPFWVLWTSLLIQTKRLAVCSIDFNLFTIGAGTGTIAGLAVYIHGGKWLVQKIKASNRSLNIAMGIIFLLTALLQLYRMIYHPFV